LFTVAFLLRKLQNNYEVQQTTSRRLVSNGITEYGKDNIKTASTCVGGWQKSTESIWNFFLSNSHVVKKRIVRQTCDFFSLQCSS